MPHTIDDERDILFGVINRFIGYFTHDSQRQSENDPESEYPFVAMDTRQVYAQIACVRQALAESGQHSQDRPAFLDIGCGIGNVLLFADQMEFDVYGLEKDPFPCSVAIKIHGPERVALQDIWEFEGYSRFDVIYYFRPFHDGALERRFERFIEEQLKPGGILIANRKMDHSIDSDPRFRRLHPEMPIWIKS
ncbi:MAG: class I SAM-dependent methyltransferase [Proteobacteria bacterium]|nr:class I SAM-dependent methyltransferase [Desulfobulbaceae bacterium]MBU4153764.1 class I SAM-dependent methyltransferase [Pseudomonadota bacterium]